MSNKRRVFIDSCVLISAGAAELITNEKPQRSIHRAKGITIRSITP